jgi:hypothetical protein
MWLAYLVLMGGSCGYALIRGGIPERAAAATILVGSVLSPFVAHLGPQLWHGFELGIFLVDAAMLIAFGIIMLLSTRFWPIWMTAFQLLTVNAYLGPLFRAKDIAIPFGFDEELWSYVILFQLALATAIETHGGLSPLLKRVTFIVSSRRKRRPKGEPP